MLTRTACFRAVHVAWEETRPTAAALLEWRVLSRRQVTDLGGEQMASVLQRLPPLRVMYAQRIAASAAASVATSVDNKGAANANAAAMKCESGAALSGGGTGCDESSCDDAGLDEAGCDEAACQEWDVDLGGSLAARLQHANLGANLGLLRLALLQRAFWRDEVNR